MSTTFQSMDHSSSLKKTRQQLEESRLGVTHVPVDTKRNSKPVQQVKRVVPKLVPTDDSSLSELKKKHQSDISNLKQEILSLKNQLSESKKENHVKLSLLEGNVLKSSDQLKQQDAERITSLEDFFSDELSKVLGLVSDLQEQFGSLVDISSVDKLEAKVQSYEAKITNQDKQLKELQLAVSESRSAIKELQSSFSNLAKSTSSSQSNTKTLHIGERFNLPEQPTVQKEGGLHKVAPLALSVNGGVVLHDIGYTTDKKGLEYLMFDPVSERLLFYKGKH